MNRSRTKSPALLVFALLTAVACGWVLCSEPEATIGSGITERRGATVASSARVGELRQVSRSARSGALPAYHAPVGSRLTYRFATRTAWAMAAEPKLDGADDVVVKPTSKSLQQTMAMRGRLVVTVAARRDDEMIVRLGFEDFVLEFPQDARGAGLDRLRRSTEAPVFVRMRDTGEILGYRFDDELVASQCDMIRGLMTSFHLIVPDPQATRWVRESADSAGRFLADYQRHDASRPRDLVVTRTRLRYVAAAAPGASCPGCSGTSRATIDRALGWLRRTEVDENIVQAMQGIGGQFTVSIRGDLELLGSESVDLVALPDREFDGAWSGLAASPERVAAEAAADERRSWQRTLRDATFEQLLGELQRTIANKAIDTPDAHGLIEALSWLVRVREDALGKVEAAIRGATAGGELDAMLMCALTKAGSPAAQDVLVAFLVDRSAPARRESAAVAMTQLASPDDTVMEVLRQQMEASSGAGRQDRMALLLFGTLATRSRGSTPGRESALQTLLAQEQRVVAQGLLPTWLEALGNAGTAAVAPRAIHYLDHDSTQVRYSAASALRDVHTNQARTALIRVARHDGDASVRAQALDALRGRDLGSVRAQILPIATADRSPDVRRLALLLDAALPKNEQSVAILQRVAKSDPEPALRDLAHRLLAGRR